MNKINSKHNKSTINSTDITRRKFVKMAGAGLACLSFPMGTALASTSVKGKENTKIVWVVLRGALDSLHTIVPTNDPQYKVLRPKLSSSFKKPLLPLANGFALHPSLENLSQWYKDKSLLPVVAVSSGYPRRSHFDGQDFLESGKGHIDHDSGWLARAIDVKNKKALAIARSTPISLRSSNQVDTWYPSNLKSANDDIYTALADLYKGDELLKEGLESGMSVRGMLIEKEKSKKKKGKFLDLTTSCAKLMVGEQGVDCAMLELGGWDTHNNQVNRLNQKLTELDQGLEHLKVSLGNEWKNTVVIIGTEFGRTAKENGTGGTDHGTGSALFIGGGAVKGGEVKGQWPGLKEEELFNKRDLMPTTNSFSWIASILVQHWDFTKQEVAEVFPHVEPYAHKLVV